MNRYQHATLYAIGLTLALLMGCGEPPVAPEAAGDATYTDNVQTHRLFTGRDSFGVAFKAHVAGQWREANSSCKRLTGTGNATHLGRVEVDQTICYDENQQITGDSFRLTGPTGGTVALDHLAGRIAPPATGPTDGTLYITAIDTITGGSVRATPQDPEVGRATLTGRLFPDGTFRYRLDGWLLHHTR